MGDPSKIIGDSIPVWSGDHFILRVAISDATADHVRDRAQVTFRTDPKAEFVFDVFQPNRDEDVWVATLGGLSTGKEASSILREASHGALMSMTSARKKVAAILPSHELAVALGLDDHQVIMAILAGVKQYVATVSEAPEHLADIMIAGGASLYKTWLVKESLARPHGLWNFFSDELALRAPDKPKAIVLQPDALQREWLEMLGTFLTGIGPDARPFRNAVFSPRQAHEREFIVTFGTVSGRPHTLKEGSVLPAISELENMEAAVHIRYYEDAGGTAHLSITPGIALNGTEIQNAILEKILGLSKFAPIIPAAQVQVEELGDGIKLVRADSALDKANTAFVEQIYGKKKTPGMTTMGEAPISAPELLKELALYLSKKTGALSAADIMYFFAIRRYGIEQYDIYIEASGRFVGTVIHRNAETSVKGTGYHLGSTANPAGMAKNVTFREIEIADGKTLRVPISYQWVGDEGQPETAFLNWFNSPAFVEARGHIAVDDNLSHIMFQGKKPEHVAALLIDYLRSHAEDMLKTDTAYYVMGNAQVPTDRAHDGANRIVNTLATDLSEGRRFDRGREVSLALLEFLMRVALGDEVVDGIFKKGGSGPVQLPGGGMVFSDGSIVNPGDIDPHGAASGITGYSRSSEWGATVDGDFSYSYAQTPSPFSYYVNLPLVNNPATVTAALPAGGLMMNGALTFSAGRSLGVTL